jgi:hypothetical protein
MENEKVTALLEEIRSLQKQHLQEYQRVANEALALQKKALEIQESAVTQQKLAVAAQARNWRLYRVVLVVAAAVIAGAIALLLSVFNT